MSRYIDADKIDYTVTIVGIDENAGYRAVAFESDIDDMPTADVVPKSEVAIEVLDEAIRAVYSKIDMKIYNTIEGKPLGDGVAFGKQQAMYDVIVLLAELKKKYTEVKNGTK